MKMCLLLSADIHGFFSGLENANKESKALEHIHGLNVSTFVVKHKHQISDKRLASAIIIWNKILRFKLTYTVKNQPQTCRATKQQRLKMKTRGKLCWDFPSQSSLVWSTSTKLTLTSVEQTSRLVLNSYNPCCTHEHILPVTFDLSNGTHNLDFSSRSWCM